MKTIRWGIIGVGNVCEVKSGPALQKANHSELVAVMRRDGDKARDFAERHHVPKWYDSADALIHDSDVDAVYIATPPHVHLDYTQRVAKAGKPVYVEKPMALSFEECQAMIDICQQENVPLWVAYYRRSLPRFVKIKSLIESGVIGEVRTLSVTLRKPPVDISEGIPWRVQPEIAGGGVFVDVGVHTLDFLIYLFGSITSVQGYARNQAQQYSAEDNVVATFIFESGVTGVGSWHFTSPDRLDETIIIGTKGTLSFSSFDTEPIKLMTADGQTLFEIDNPTHIQQPLIQSIVDELNGVNKCPSTGLTGSQVTWMTDQILKS